MGDWQNTSYLEEADARRVAEAIVALLGEEGMQQVASPAPREPERFDAMQYAAAMENNLWGVAVFPGAPGWTIVKTAPLELVGERAPGAGRMRLAELAGRLGAAGCQINLYDSTSLVLAEVDRQGGCLLSGYGRGTDRNPDPLRFNGEQLAEERVEVRFELLPLQRLVEESTDDDGPMLDNDALIARLAATLGGDNADWCDNITSVDFLLRHRPLPMRGGIALYFEWPARDRQARSLPMPPGLET